ncbi:unnamed protein product [Nezara viridula]|uniref:G-protein coupled receptors family 1 profile domain-containing protein n=1 Tax=Nezara viridula TaxID=85310 RepID=A0A9P0DZ78_NEZVI|nr:unnamed protein product [Nezara viridula]
MQGRDMKLSLSTFLPPLFSSTIAPLPQRWVPPQMNLTLLNTTILNSTEVQEFRYSFPVTVFFCLAYTSVFIIGVIGNVLVVSVVLRTPRMRSPTNLFIANLALADLLVEGYVFISSNNDDLFPNLSPKFIHPS